MADLVEEIASSQQGGVHGHNWRIETSWLPGSGRFSGRLSKVEEERQVEYRGNPKIIWQKQQ